MYTDRELTASDSQVITATAVSTDSIVLNGFSLGRAYSPDLRAYAQVDQNFTASGAATLTVEIIQADNGALTTNVQSLYSSGALALAALTTGSEQFLIDVPMPKVTKPYVGFRYTVATGPMTAGQITAGFTPLTPTDLNDQPTYWTGYGA